MGLQPNIARKRNFTVKTCSKCGALLPPTQFAPTKSFFYADGAVPICNGCAEEWLAEHDFDWAAVDKLC